MDLVQGFFFDHPFWVWLAIGAVLLAVEMMTGSGWLLWPAASAGVMAVLSLTGINLGWPIEVVTYAVLTIVTSLTARKVFPPKPETGPDINDRTSELLGKHGEATGSHRVLVDGAEWEAESPAGEALTPGSKVEVVQVLGGARLSVRVV